MGNLTAIAFPDKFRAEQMPGHLREAEKDGLANINEAVVLLRDEDGRLRRASGLDEKLPKWAGTAGGAGLGLVLSSLVWPGRWCSVRLPALRLRTRPPPAARSPA